MSLGASKLDWRLWAVDLGLVEDLLPVVCRGDAPVSPQSTLRALGKTPSQYASGGLVVGIPRWTQREATLDECRQWARQPDYGICLQTRRVRALDIDTDDPLQARTVLDTVRQALPGVPLPARRRPGSARCALLFRFDGPLYRRLLRLPKPEDAEKAGIVELLATGQQLVVAGQHVSTGTRYFIDWPEGAVAIPELTAEQVEALWGALVEAHGAGDVTLSGRDAGEDFSTADEVAAWLLSEQSGWPVHGRDHAGRRLYVECPWKAGHSSDSGPSEAAWLLAGSSGYARGHFRCQHASCAHRTTEDFLAAVGYYRAGLPALVPSADPPPSGGTPKPEGDLPPFERNDAGYPTTTLGNLLLALEHPALASAEDVFLDSFSGTRYVRLGISSAAADEECEELPGYRYWDDGDYVWLAARLRSVFCFVRDYSLEVIRQSIGHFFKTRVRHLVREWVRAHRWDGVLRVDSFLSEALGMPQSAYLRSVSRYMWTALAGRATSNFGVKADMIPVLIGGEGCGKSMLVAALAPWPTATNTLGLHSSDADIARTGRGTVVRELAELRALRSRDEEAVKAWVTQTHDVWVPKYKEAQTRVVRTWLVIATTNERAFLNSSEVNRRWLPVEIPAASGNAPAKMAQRLQKDKQLLAQLWAEALLIFATEGVAYVETAELAGVMRVEHEVDDPLDDILDRALTVEYNGRPRWQSTLSFGELFTELSVLLPRRTSNAGLAKALHARGFERYSNGRRRCWRPTEKTATYFGGVLPTADVLSLPLDKATAVG